MENNYIRFDWAMKHLLRDKAYFVVLDGFLTTLLDEHIKIKLLLESEANKENEQDQLNRVDLLAENSLGELIIIEIQNNRELDYLHPMLYGTSKLITEHLSKGQAYGIIRKVYSVNIIYFDLGQGVDYVYKGKTEFKGLHKHDALQLSESQQKQFMRQTVDEIYPEYYVLCLQGFDNMAHSPLDEWIAFLKTGNIEEQYTASGLPEARKLLHLDQLSPEESIRYKHDFESLNHQRKVITTGYIEGKNYGFIEGHAQGHEKGLRKGLVRGIEKGREEGLRQAILAMKENGISTEQISQMLGYAVEEMLNSTCKCN